jgi:hypothetical protein
MIQIIAYHVTNGERSERFDYDKVVIDINELNSLKSQLMQSNDNHRIDLVYRTIADLPKEPEQVIHVERVDYPDVIKRNQNKIRKFINNLKH